MPPPTISSGILLNCPTISSEPAEATSPEDVFVEVGVVFGRSPIDHEAGPIRPSLLTCVSVLLPPARCAVLQFLIAAPGSHSSWCTSAGRPSLIGGQFRHASWRSCSGNLHRHTSSGSGSG